jgi:hypothetical protein
LILDVREVVEIYPLSDNPATVEYKDIVET